jgi:galactose mutarotase-like enzyme
MSEPLTLTASDGLTQAMIYPALGGLCASLKVPYPDAHGQISMRELFYLPEDFESRCQQKICGGLPFHFPACGRTAHGIYQIADQAYTMPIHGFSATQAWTLESQSAEGDYIHLTLRESPSTLTHYPFCFELSLKYQIQPQSLEVVCEIFNPNQTDLPFSMGFHPYFYVPVSQKSSSTLDFIASKSIAYNETLTDLAAERPLQAPMPAYLTDEGLNERLSVLNRCHLDATLTGALVPRPILLSIPEQPRIELTLNAHDSVIRAEITRLERSPHQNPEGQLQYLQLYHDPEQPFFCIEPWAGTPNSLNHPERLIHLAPRQRLTRSLIIAGR